MKKLPKFIPVIHVISSSHAVEQAEIAFDNGAGGIFLIDHYKDYKHLLEVYSMVRETFTYDWIGLNFLDLEPEAAILKVLSHGIDGLWMDHVRGVGQDEVDMNRNHLLFAGTNFKYQDESREVDIRKTNRIANLFDVTTTSGPATGRAPTLDKVEKMKYIIGSRPLALASGVTLNNVESFIPFVDCFMVATGISKPSNDVLDPKKVLEMANILNK